MMIDSLQLVIVVVNTWHLNLDTLAFPHFLDNLTGLAGGVKRISTGEDLPMIEDGLREGLTSSSGTEIGSETEGLVDGQVGLDVEKWGTHSLLLSENVTSPLGQDTIDTTHGLLRNSDLDQVDWLQKSWLSEKSSCVQDTTGSWDDLSTTSVDGIGVEGDIHDVEPDAAHGLLSDWSLTGSPLESRDDGILDFGKVLDGLGLINQQVGTVGVWSETPNLPGVGNIPTVLIGQNTGTELEIITGRDLARLNGLGNILVKWLGNHVKTIVLVGRLGQSGDARLASNGLSVLDDWG